MKKKVIVGLLAVIGLVGGLAVAQSAIQNKSAAALAGAPIADGDTGQVVGLTTTSQQYTLPAPGGAYLVCAEGNTAYVRCGTDPTATISVGGYAFLVSGCLPIPVRLSGPKCAVIAPTSVGVIQFIRVISP